MIPTLHRSFSPQKDVTSMSLVPNSNCGKDDKSLDDLNKGPLNCSAAPIPIRIKSDGLNEKHPILERSRSIVMICIPNGTPTIIKSPLSFVLTVYL